MTARRTRPLAGAALLSLAAVLLAACSGPVGRPAQTGGTAPQAGAATSPAQLTAAFAAAAAPSPSTTSAPASTTGIAVPWCRSADLTVRYLGGDSTTVDPALDVIERYRVTNSSPLPCRAGAWIGVTMLGVAGCPAPSATAAAPSTTAPLTTAPATTGTGATGTGTAGAWTTDAEACPAGPVPTRGQGLRSAAWPARDQVLSPGGSTVLSLLFADTYAPQSCPEVWAPPARLELRPAGDPHPLVVDAKVYPCKGRLLVAPLGFGL